MKHGLTILAVALLALTSYGDTFTHKTTGETLTGQLVTRTEKDDQPVLFVKLSTGKTRVLTEAEWTVTKDPAHREVAKLRKQVAYLEAENARLRAKLERLRAKLDAAGVASDEPQKADTETKPEAGRKYDQSGASGLVAILNSIPKKIHPGNNWKSMLTRMAVEWVDSNAPGRFLTVRGRLYNAVLADDALGVALTCEFTYRGVPCKATVSGYIKGIDRVREFDAMKLGTLLTMSGTIRRASLSVIGSGEPELRLMIDLKNFCTIK